MRRRLTVAALVLVACVEGMTSRHAAAPPARRGDWLVVQADFHVHGFTADGTQSPLGLILQAREHGLHVFALATHNRLFAGRVGAWLSRYVGGVTVIVGEEITSPDYHLLGIGLSRRVAWDQPASAAIDSVHAQGGVAIAAHPLLDSWQPRDSATLSRLDGVEVAQSLSFERAGTGAQMRELYTRAHALRPSLAAIGSSDHHWLNTMGTSRTYVFVRENSASEIVAAVRAGRTVVRDVDGTLVGDPAWVALLGAPDRAPPPPNDYRVGSVLAAIARACGWLGAVGLLLFG